MQPRVFLCVAIAAILLTCIPCSGMIPGTAIPGQDIPSPTTSTAPVLSIPATTPEVPLSLPATGPGAQPVGAIISGQVFLGPPGSDESPLPGVSLELFCSSVATSPGVPDGVVKTDSSGYYTFDVSDQCNFYTIVISTEGEIIHAESEKGVVIEGNRIRLASPPIGTVSGGNNFWVSAATNRPTTAPPGSPESGIVIGGIVVVVVAIIVLLGALVLRRRSKSDECR
jgi:hypothetical protein